MPFPFILILDISCMIKKLFVLILLIFLVILWLMFRSSNLESRLKGWGISLDTSSFSLVSLDKDERIVSKVEKLEAVFGTTKVFIDRIEIEDHRKYIEDKKFLLESLFLPTTSPYPEVITNIIECPSEFKPKVRATNNGVVYALFANERLSFGVCSKDLVKYYSEYGIFDCGAKGVLKFAYFQTIVIR